MDTEAAVPEGESEGEPDADEGLEEGSDEGAGEGADSGLDSDPDGDATAVPQPPRETAAVPPAHPRPSAKQTVTRAERPAEPTLRILPLGGGLILVGLGLGLAFVALRLRRAAS